MIKVVTFDLDDTLWDVTPVLMRAERLLFAWLQRHCPQLQQRFSLQELRAMRMEIIKSRPDLIHQITTARHVTLQTAMLRAGLDAATADEFSAQAMQVFMEARHDVELFDQVEEVVAQLYGRYTLGVLTNGNADIYRLPLGRYFAFAYSAEALNSSKPMPLHFERTLHTTGAMAQEIVHVGDHLEHDVAAAQHCGWHTIWLNSKQQEFCGESPPTAIVSDIGQIPAAIEKIAAATAP
jgi:putative hydrolase of the HAD superfamily